MDTRHVLSSTGRNVLTGDNGLTGVGGRSEAVAVTVSHIVAQRLVDFQSRFSLGSPGNLRPRYTALRYALIFHTQ